MEDEIYDIKKLSLHLNISIPEIRKLVREKKIPHFRIERRILFKKKSIDNWINNLEDIEGKKSVFY